MLVHCGKHHPYLPLAAFMDDDTVAVGRLPLELAHLRRPGDLTLDVDALFEAALVVLRQTAREGDIILLLVLEPGVCQLVRQLAVIGQNKQPRAVLVQTSCRMQPCLAQVVGKQFHYGGSATVVLGSAQIAVRLVHGDVHTPRAFFAGALACHDDLVCGRVDRLCVRLGNLAVDLNEACLDEDNDSAPGAVAGVGQRSREWHSSHEVFLCVV